MERSVSVGLKYDDSHVLCVVCVHNKCTAERTMRNVRREVVRRWRGQPLGTVHRYDVVGLGLGSRSYTFPFPQ